MRNCNKCGAEINNNQGFCTSCGSKVVDNQNNLANNKVKTDKMIIIGIITVAIIGAGFSSIKIIKKSSSKETLVVGEVDSSSLNNNLNYENDVNEDIENTNSNLVNSNSNNNTNNNTNINDNYIPQAAKYYIDKYKDRDYIIPDSNSVEVNFKSLNKYTAEELLIAKNEMLARYGHVFEYQPNLQAYFESKSWYQPNKNGQSELSRDVEKVNYKLIKSLEFLKQARDSNVSIVSSFVLPNSNTVELTSSDVAVLNDWELVVARNEIFARYGLEFSTKELMEHFKTKSWFVIDSSVGNDLALNSIENKNLVILLEEEQMRIEARSNYDLGQ